MKIKYTIEIPLVEGDKVICIKGFRTPWGDHRIFEKGDIHYINSLTTHCIKTHKLGLLNVSYLVPKQYFKKYKDEKRTK